MAAPVTTIRRWSALTAALLLLVSGALAACGGGSSGSGDSTASQSSGASGGGYGGGAASTGGSDSSTLSISAVENGSSLGFSQRALSARAGTVTIKLANGSGDQFPHGIAIEGNGVDKDGQVVQPGGSSTVTLRLKPGRYTFYCPVGGHEDAGMKGTLTVS